MFGGRHRRGPKGRKPKPIKLGISPIINAFIPFPQANLTPILLEPAELEALRLVDLEGLSQEEAGTRMGVSCGTVGGYFKAQERKLPKL